MAAQDGTTIGASSAAAGTFTNVTATGTVTIATADINGGAIDGTNIGKHGRYRQIFCPDHGGDHILVETSQTPASVSASELRARLRGTQPHICLRRQQHSPCGNI